MRRALGAAIAFGVILGLVGCFWVQPVPTVSPVGRKILLPLYIYPMWWLGEPGYQWPRVARAAAQAEIWAIINPASGPGGPPNADYQRGLTDLKNAGVTMLGYVWTAYGAKPLADVKAEVDVYAEHFAAYGVQGIFYDGVNSSAAWLAYYQELYAYAKAKGFRWVVLNPGTTIDEAYLAQGVGDIIVVFEDNYTNFLAHVFPDYVRRYPKERFAVLLWGVPSLSAAEEVLLRIPFAAFVHCTDDVPPNEWDTLPTYWEGWVELFRKPLYYVP
ncbi:MAG: spherulation-specific family 4 protein [Candidatus Bipolaricaulaceae bacterium]